MRCCRPRIFVDAPSFCRTRGVERWVTGEVRVEACEKPPSGLAKCPPSPPPPPAGGARAVIPEPSPSRRPAALGCAWPSPCRLRRTLLPVLVASCFCPAFSFLPAQWFVIVLYVFLVEVLCQITVFPPGLSIVSKVPFEEKVLLVLMKSDLSVFALWLILDLL